MVAVDNKEDDEQHQGDSAMPGLTPSHTHEGSTMQMTHQSDTLCDHCKTAVMEVCGLLETALFQIQITKNIAVSAEEGVIPGATPRGAFQFFQKVHITSLDEAGWLTITVSLVRFLVILGVLLYALLYQVGESLGYVNGVKPEFYVAGLLRWPESTSGAGDSYLLPTLLDTASVSYCQGLDWQG